MPSRIERFWGFYSPNVIISHSSACFAIEVTGSGHLLLTAKQQLAYSSQNSGSGEGGAVFYLQEKLNSVMSVCVVRKSIWKEEMYWDPLHGMTPGSQRASHVCTVFPMCQFKSRVTLLLAST